jgi:hypothetical protein
MKREPAPTIKPGTEGPGQQKEENPQMNINLTPHNIVVLLDSGEQRVIPPSGQIARCASKPEDLTPVGGVPAARMIWTNVTGLPDPAPDTVYIVSSFVAQHPNVAAGKRPDVFSPRTDNTAIRAEGGKTVPPEVLAEILAVLDGMCTSSYTALADRIRALPSAAGQIVAVRGLQQF